MKLEVINCVLEGDTEYLSQGRCFRILLEYEHPLLSGVKCRIRKGVRSGWLLQKSGFCF